MTYHLRSGLSSYDTNTNNSAEYLKPLLEFAADIIPSDKHSQTPLYILATAGMRLISKQWVRHSLPPLFLCMVLSYICITINNVF